jgi:hypothetical protein
LVLFDGAGEKLFLYSAKSTMTSGAPPSLGATALYLNSLVCNDFTAAVLCNDSFVTESIRHWLVLF